MQQLVDCGAQAGAVAEMGDALAPVLWRENEFVRLAAVIGRQKLVDPAALCGALLGTHASFFYIWWVKHSGKMAHNFLPLLMPAAHAVQGK